MIISYNFHTYIEEFVLFAGGSESELYIWDVNKLSTPMTPGAKSQPLDDIRCVAWNREAAKPPVTFHVAIENCILVPPTLTHTF